MSDVGGRYFTQLDLERSKAEGKTVYNEGQAFSLKQNDYFRTDLRIAEV